MKLYGGDRRELMSITRIEREGNQLLVQGKVFGAVPVTALVTPAEVRSGLRLLGWSGVLFLMTMPFRKSPAP